jgi:hypothetical protein
MKETIRLSGIAGFAEDKDQARSIRIDTILPALERGHNVVLDFQDIKYATQSYIHALVGEPLQRYGESIIDQIEFKNCSQQLRSVIELVVDYSLGGFEDAGSTSREPSFEVT